MPYSNIDNKLNLPQNTVHVYKATKPINDKQQSCDTHTVRNKVSRHCEVIIITDYYCTIQQHANSEVQNPTNDLHILLPLITIMETTD